MRMNKLYSPRGVYDPLQIDLHQEYTMKSGCEVTHFHSYFWSYICHSGLDPLLVTPYESGTLNQLLFIHPEYMDKEVIRRTHQKLIKMANYKEYRWNGV